MRYNIASHPQRYCSQPTALKSINAALNTTKSLTRPRRQSHERIYDRQLPVVLQRVLLVPLLLPLRVRVELGGGRRRQRGRLARVQHAAAGYPPGGGRRPTGEVVRVDAQQVGLGAAVAGGHVAGGVEKKVI